MMWFHLAAVLIYLVALAVIGIWRTRRRPRQPAMTSSWPAARFRRLSWSSRCSRPGSARAACLPVPGSGTGRDSRRSGSRRARGSASAVIFFLAPRVRRLAQYTVPDILELRYGSTARVLGAITIVLRLHRDRRVPVSRRRAAAAPDRRSRPGDRRASSPRSSASSSPRPPACARSPSSTWSTA